MAKGGSRGFNCSRSAGASHQPQVGRFFRTLGVLLCTGIEKLAQILASVSNGLGNNDITHRLTNWNFTQSGRRSRRSGGVSGFLVGLPATSSGLLPQTTRCHRAGLRNDEQKAFSVFMASTRSLTNGIIGRNNEWKTRLSEHSDI